MNGTETDIELYKFEDLSNRAKDKARQYFDLEYEWWDYVYSDAKERGKELGFHIHDIDFSGFWSQGDGASWVGRIDVREFCDSHVKDYPELLYVSLLAEGCGTSMLMVTRRGWYSHEYTMRVEELSEYDVPLEGTYQGEHAMYHGVSLQEMSDLVDWDDVNIYILDSARSFAKGIYRELEDEYENLTSDEYLQELCESNGYLFDEHGELQ